LCAVHQSAVFQAARSPLTSGTVGVIPASGQLKAPLKRGRMPNDWRKNKSARAA